MEKPTTLKIKDLRENLVKAINESGLPAYLVRYEVNQVAAEVERLAKQVEMAEQKQYEESRAGEYKEKHIEEEEECHT